MDDECHDTYTVFKDERIEKPKPKNKPVNPQVKGQFKDEETEFLRAIGHACCDFRAKYEKLLRQHERAGDQLRTVSRNLELVTRQLVARDGDMIHYMDTVSQLFNLVSRTSFNILTRISSMCLALYDLFRVFSQVQNPIKF